MRKLMDFIDPNAPHLGHGEKPFRAFLALLSELDQVPEERRGEEAGSALVTLAAIMWNWVAPEDLPVLLEAVLERFPGIEVSRRPIAAPPSQARH